VGGKIAICTAQTRVQAKVSRRSYSMKAVLQRMNCTHQVFTSYSIIGSCEATYFLIKICCFRAIFPEEGFSVSGFLQPEELSPDGGGDTPRKHCKTHLILYEYNCHIKECSSFKENKEKTATVKSTPSRKMIYSKAECQKNEFCCRECQRSYFIQYLSVMEKI
jgi:hypothetical protein